MTIFRYVNNQIFTITNIRYIIRNQLNVKEKFLISPHKKNFGSKASTELPVLIKVVHSVLNAKYNKFIDSTICDMSKSKNNFVSPTRSYIVYILRSITFSGKIILVSSIGRDNLLYPIERIFNAANWSEREIFDMSGILFIGNTNMKRIPTDYGFMGFPLRKDFPVTGFSESNHNSEFETVIYEPVNFMQEERIFESYNVWAERMSKIIFGFSLHRTFNHILGPIKFRFRKNKVKQRK